jgi:large subunit ribosomal protein L6
MFMEKIEIPTGTQVSVEKEIVSIKGRLGSTSKKYNRKFTSVKVEGNSIIVEGSKIKSMQRRASTAEHALANVLKDSIKNVNDGIEEKMKIVYAHFPMSVEIKDKEISIKNIFGEKVARKTNIVGNTKVEIKGQDVTVKGIDRYDVGQTVANIRKACAARGNDTRVFQDGIYTVIEE